MLTEKSRPIAAKVSYPPSLARSEIDGHNARRVKPDLAYQLKELAKRESGCAHEVPGDQNKDNVTESASIEEHRRKILIGAVRQCHAVLVSHLRYVAEHDDEHRDDPEDLNIGVAFLCCIHAP